MKFIFIRNWELVQEAANMPDKPLKRWGKSGQPSSNGHHANGSQSSTWLSGQEDSRHPADSRYPAGGKLRGKVALIVGDANDTSKGLAIGLAELGANVILIYANGADEVADTIARQVESCGRRCLTISGQEQGERFPQEVIRKIKDSFGRLDIFIDCSQRASAASRPSHNDSSKPGVSLQNQLFPHMALLKAALSEILAGKGEE
jgi:hypothetical protein